MWPKLGLLPEKDTWVCSRAPLPQVQVTLARPAPDLDLSLPTCATCVSVGAGGTGGMAGLSMSFLF